MTLKNIPFNKAFMTGKELDNISQAYSQGALSGNGQFSHACETWLQNNTNTERALLTHSCTGALEMAALLLDLKPGDEVIMPAYTFVSTANAVVLRGAKPVFADIRPDTLNIDETKIEELITARTKSIWVVHYAGVSCEMDRILAIAKRHNLTVVEDAAQGIMASYKGKALGSIGDLGTLSFHETKNVTCGEGGALMVNRADFIEPAEIIHEKGTDRRNFSRGIVDKYTWQSMGSSYVLGELAAAFLRAQFDSAKHLTERRLSVWERYNEAFEPLEEKGVLKRPFIPSECQHNAHMFYILLEPQIDRAAFIAKMRALGIHAVFHYVPLDTAPMGKSITDHSRPLPNTADLASRIVRLPLWVDMKNDETDYVVEAVCRTLL